VKAIIKQQTITSSLIQCSSNYNTRAHTKLPFCEADSCSTIQEVLN